MEQSKPFLNIRILWKQKKAQTFSRGEGCLQVVLMILDGTAFEKQQQVFATKIPKQDPDPMKNQTIHSIKGLHS